MPAVVVVVEMMAVVSEEMRSVCADLLKGAVELWVLAGIAQGLVAVSERVVAVNLQ